jgi:hypothetical protein
MATSTAFVSIRASPWWKQPTKDQWMVYLAAWLGWTLDAFDFTIFQLIMVPIANEFGGLVRLILAVRHGPEIKGKVLVPDLVAGAGVAPAVPATASPRLERFIEARDRP